MKTGLFSVFSALVLLVSGIFFPWSKTMLIIGLCYGLSALGVAIPAKSGQVSFGHAMFACVAAYSVAFIARAFPAMDGLLLLVLATLFGTLFSFVGLVCGALPRYYSLACSIWRSVW
jgi:ABC-type branched-subunit amino acid transport system permease subunit